MSKDDVWMGRILAERNIPGRVLRDYGERLGLDLTSEPADVLRTEFGPTDDEVIEGVRARLADS